MDDNNNKMEITPEMIVAGLKAMLEAANQSEKAEQSEEAGGSGSGMRPLVKLCDPKGLRVVRGDSILDLDRLETGDPNDKCYYRCLLDVKEAPHFMPVMLVLEDATSFDWFCGYSELDYVIEGVLELTIDGRKYSLREGDISLIPMRSQVNFATPDHCKALAIVYPTNWGDYC